MSEKTAPSVHRDRAASRARAADAGERVQRFAVNTREIIANNDRHIERLGHTFDPADQIDGGTDHGEIEPVGGADIAVDRRADVKRDTISSGGSLTSEGSR